MEALFAKIREWKVAILLFIAAIVFSGLSLGAAGSIALNNHEEVKAQALLAPFGGPITSVLFCTCSFNLLLIIGPPAGGVFTFRPGTSLLFAFGQIYRPGPWTVGGYTPGGACLMFVGLGCAPIPAQGTMRLVGTSV